MVHNVQTSVHWVLEMIHMQLVAMWLIPCILRIVIYGIEQLEIIPRCREQDTHSYGYDLYKFKISSTGLYICR